MGRPRATTTRWAGVYFAAVLLFASSAFAQRVVILDFEGDARGKLRNQVENAVRSQGKVELLTLSRYRDAASRVGVVGPRAMTPAGVAQVARGLGISVALEGAVGDTFFVRMLDPEGQELWSKELPMRRGLISADHARKLATALAAAANQVSANSGTPPPAKEPPPTVVERPVKTPTPTPPPEDPSVRNPPPSKVIVERGTPENPPPPSEPSRREENLREPSPSTPPAGTLAPPLFHFTGSGTTTWRSYCSRPGTATCRAYDALDESQRAPGDIVDFVAQVPYAGFHLEAEVFPFAHVDNALKGLGVGGKYDRGFSLTNVQVHSTDGDTPSKPVSSVDEVWDAGLLYRYFFGVGSTDGKPLPGFVGVRLGYGSRSFEVDPTAEVPLPGTHRHFPFGGLEAAFPFHRFFGVDVGIYYLIDPKPVDNDIVAYGTTAHAIGIAGRAGIFGNLWGPVGYEVRFQYQYFHDTFVGEGTQWTTGGTAEETYVELYWGATVKF